MNIGAIVFDFDGTLVDSNTIKRQAFFDLFDNHAVTRAIVCDVLAQKPSAPRREIIRAIGEELDIRADEDVDQLTERYGAAVCRSVGTCEEVPGATALLRNLSARYPLYISSGTPADALRHLVAMRGWTAHFLAVFGHPVQKIDALRLVCRKHNLPAAWLLMVGDSEADRVAATRAGCRFFDVRLGRCLSGLDEWILDQEHCTA